MRFWNFLRERETSVRCQTFLLDCWVHVMFAHTHACQSKASYILFFEVLHSMFFSFLFFSSYLSAFLIFTRIITPMQSEALGGWKKWCHSEDKHFIFSQIREVLKKMSTQWFVCLYTVNTSHVNWFHSYSLLLLTVQICICKSSGVMLESRGTLG